MNNLYSRLLLISFLYLLSTFFSGLLSQDAKDLFSEHSKQIFQIRIIDLESGKQSSLGSGFQISQDGFVISNFHVISDYALYPDEYRIERVDHDGSISPLKLVSLDVVNDLSLLKSELSAERYLELSKNLPEHGEPIYSLGNPHDLGLTVVPGTFNGITTYSVYERIHVSGAINAGMSGGPTLNSLGQVIGVNVASSGNQVGFLIPLHRLRNFVEKSKDETIEMVDINDEITTQLYVNQDRLMNEILKQDWEIVEFGEAFVPDKIASHIKCWSVGNDLDQKYEQTTSYCRDNEDIFISNTFTTGVIMYQFDWLESNELNRFQFYNLVKNKTSSMAPDNYANEENVTEYECRDSFIKTESNIGKALNTKVSFCARAYKKYPNLYDVLYMGATLNENDKALLSHFSLAGVSKEISNAFFEKFLTSITWKLQNDSDI